MFRGGKACRMGGLAMRCRMYAAMEEEWAGGQARRADWRGARSEVQNTMQCNLG